MNINFFTLNPSDKSGSYRIWVKDVSLSLKELGHESKICTKYSDIDPNCDCLILCKSAYKTVDAIANMYPNLLIGAINIDKDYYNKNIQFVIVGSLEEYVSMSSYENVFIVPLIERKFENIEIKNHAAQKELRVCYHGHYPHLFKFEPFIKNALEEINKEIPTTLVCITGNPNFEWKIGKPNIKIEMYDYNKDFINIVQSCDIGIVPNVSDLRLTVKGLEGIVNSNFGLYNTDYFLRMKNKTNAGRAYVFYQLGIPVIHDLSPSSFELLSKTELYICAHDKKSYYKEIKKLLDFNLRNKVATKNKKVFEENYNAVNHAKKLITQIEGIK